MLASLLHSRPHLHPHSRPKKKKTKQEKVLIMVDYLLYELALIAMEAFELKGHNGMKGNHYSPQKPSGLASGGSLSLSTYPATTTSDV